MTEPRVTAEQIAAAVRKELEEVVGAPAHLGKLRPRVQEFAAMLSGDELPSQDVDVKLSPDGVMTVTVPWPLSPEQAADSVVAPVYAHCQSEGHLGFSEQLLDNLSANTKLEKEP